MATTLGHADDRMAPYGHDYGKTTELSGKEHRFNPYGSVGGTVMALACDGHAVLAACTRLSSGYSILSRDQSKLTQLTEKCAIGSAGSQNDVRMLHKRLLLWVEDYKNTHRKEPSITAVARHLSCTLYGRRFFPWYAFNILVGSDAKGCAVFSYDAVGSFERQNWLSMGTGSSMATSVLDCVLGGRNRNEAVAALTKEESVALARRVMDAVAERDISTGDNLDLWVFDTNEGLRKEKHALRLD